jgi:hypothetical protein
LLGLQGIPAALGVDAVGGKVVLFKEKAAPGGSWGKSSLVKAWIGIARIRGPQRNAVLSREGETVPGGHGEGAIR